MSKNSTCSIESCNNSNYCRTWCRPHYRKWERTGDPNYNAAATRYKNLTEKVMSRIDKNDPNGCWIWIVVVGAPGAVYGLKRHFCGNVSDLNCSILFPEPSISSSCPPYSETLLTNSTPIVVVALLHVASTPL